MSKDKVSLLEAVIISTREIYSKAAAAALASNKEIMVIKNASEGVQRGIINRVLINKLLQHRATSEHSVVDAIHCLIPDGDNDAWMNIFKTVVLPYLKENKVKL